MVLGEFRTNILAENNRKTSRLNPISDYDTTVEKLAKRQDETNGVQPGDPQQAVERILDVVPEEGSMDRRKDAPMRMPLGSDAVAIIRGECLKTLSEVEEFQEISYSTDYAEKNAVPAYQ